MYSLSRAIEGVADIGMRIYNDQRAQMERELAVAREARVTSEMARFQLGIETRLNELNKNTSDPEVYTKQALEVIRQERNFAEQRMPKDPITRMSLQATLDSTVANRLIKTQEEGRVKEIPYIRSQFTQAADHITAWGLQSPENMEPARLQLDALWNSSASTGIYTPAQGEALKNGSYVSLEKGWVSRVAENNPDYFYQQDENTLYQQYPYLTRTDPGWLATLRGKIEDEDYTRWSRKKTQQAYNENQLAAGALQKMVQMYQEGQPESTVRDWMLGGVSNGEIPPAETPGLWSFMNSLFYQPQGGKSEDATEDMVWEAVRQSQEGNTPIWESVRNVADYFGLSTKGRLDLHKGATEFLGVVTRIPEKGQILSIFQNELNKRSDGMGGFTERDLMNPDQFAIRTSLSPEDTDRLIDTIDSWIGRDVSKLGALRMGLSGAQGPSRIVLDANGNMDLAKTTERIREDINQVFNRPPLTSRGPLEQAENRQSLSRYLTYPAPQPGEASPRPTERERLLSDYTDQIMQGLTSGD
jgi:hypothetical protein